MFYKRKNKFGAIKTNGYDSKKENKRAGELKMLEKAGVICKLREQPCYELQPGFRDLKGAAERAIKYIADFEYYDNEKKAWVVEDAKGFKTKEYMIKKKLFKFKYPEILFQEV